MALTVRAQLDGLFAVRRRRVKFLSLISVISQNKLLSRSFFARRFSDYADYTKLMKRGISRKDISNYIKYLRINLRDLRLNFGNLMKIPFCFLAELPLQLTEVPSFSHKKIEEDAARIYFLYVCLANSAF